MSVSASPSDSWILGGSRAIIGRNPGGNAETGRNPGGNVETGRKPLGSRPEAARKLGGFSPVSGRNWIGNAELGRNSVGNWTEIRARGGFQAGVFKNKSLSVQHCVIVSVSSKAIQCKYF